MKGWPADTTLNTRVSAKEPHCVKYQEIAGRRLMALPKVLIADTRLSDGGRGE